MAHASKKWIRDWRGRLKRSRHRTQQDWKGGFATQATVDSRIGQRRKCPQCTFLSKRAHTMYWTVRVDLATIAVAHNCSWYDHAEYRRLRKLDIWVQGERVGWTAGGKATWLLYHRVRVHEERRLAEYPPGSDVREARWHVEECDACRRKQEVAWRRWHAGGPLVGLGARRRNSHVWARRQEQRDRRAEVRNLMGRAKHDPELYDFIPTKHKNRWLD